MITDARSVCDERLTRKEVKLLREILRLKKEDTILDLCGGQGRHSLELARLGYKKLTVLDSSDYLIRLGRKLARKKRLAVNFILADARSIPIGSHHYSAIFMMANSFGYFLNEDENCKILKEAGRLLKKGGKLLLDLCSADYVKRNLVPVSWHMANNDIIVCRKRKIEKDIVKAQEIVLSKRRGLLRDGHYCEKLYDENKIKRLFKKAKLKNIKVRKRLNLHKNKTDYGFMTSRMFVTATK